jgi:aminopeptidase N
MTRFVGALTATVLALPLWAALHYDLDVTVMPIERRMHVEGELSLTMERESDQVSFLLSKRMSNVRLLLRSANADIASTSVSSEPRGEDRLWVVRTKSAVGAGTKLILSFRYDAAGETASQYFVGPEVSFASAWGTNWYPLLQSSDNKSTARIRLRIPPGHDAMATGKRIADQRDARARVVEFQVATPTYLAFATGAFHIHRREGKRPLSAYLLKERANADAWLEGAEAIVAALEKEFGPYPFPEIAFVEIPRSISTAAEFNAASLQGFMLLNHRAFDVAAMSGLWEWLAHEISHGWFPHHLSFKRPGGRFMEEAFAEYGALCAVESLGGHALAKEFRISGYPADPIYSAAAYFRLVDRGLDHPVGVLQPLDAHRDLAYTKGSFFLYMLAHKVGRERFRIALREVADAHAFQKVEWWTFLQELQRRVDVDLSLFYDQWLHRTGAPSWTSTWSNVPGGVEVTLQQTAPAYQLDLPVRVTLESGATLERNVLLESEEKTLHLPTPSRASSVEIDPDFQILHRPTPPAPPPPPVP